MYYLDFHSLYRHTWKEERIQVRKLLNRNEVMERRLKLQHDLCFYCAAPINMKDHLDHIIPIYYGGTNRPVNMVAACKDCNLYKNTHQLEITNQNTIDGYLRLIEARERWEKKVKAKPYLRRYQPKKVQLYTVYRADLFKNIPVRHTL